MLYCMARVAMTSLQHRSAALHADMRTMQAQHT
jgi:hypothetical protein